MSQRIAHLFLSLITLLFVFVACEETEPDNTDGNTGATIIDTLEVGDSVLFPDFLVAFMPAPGQFVNTLPGLPKNAESIIGQVGLVSLGGYGGYIIVGFHTPILNHPDHPYGVDFSIIGNAYEGSSEPGIVMVMQDKNNNGLADEQWYELKGKDHENKSTISDYQLTYYYINDTTVTWKDNLGESGTLLRNSYHSQSYYTSPDNYPNSHPDSLTFKGTRLPSKSYYDETNGNWVNPSFGYGYADNHQVNQGLALNIPDNPMTTASEGCGGDAFDIDWAIDAQGNNVALDSIYFIKVYNAVFDVHPVIGEVSTEIRAIVPVKE